MEVKTMLEIRNIYKTFNPGTINKKVALNGLSLKLNEGRFRHCHRWKRCWKIHNAECGCRCMACR